MGGDGIVRKEKKKKGEEMVVRRDEIILEVVSVVPNGIRDGGWRAAKKRFLGRRKRDRRVMTRRVKTC